MEAIPLQWLLETQPITRVYLISSIGLSIVEALGYIKVSDFTLNKSDILSMKYLLRIPLNLVYNGKFSFNFCTRLYLFTRYSNWLETSVQSSRNFSWMIFIIVLLINLYSLFITNLQMIGPTFKETLLYIWTKNNPDVEVLFLIILVKGSWLPWISFILEMAVLGSKDKKVWLIEGSGIIIGHLFWFVNERIPLLNNCQSPFAPIWDWKLFKNAQLGEGEDDDERVEEEEEEQAEQAGSGVEYQHSQIQPHIEDTPQLIEEGVNLEEINNNLNEEVESTNYDNDHQIISPTINDNYQRETIDMLHQR